MNSVDYWQFFEEYDHQLVFIYLTEEEEIYGPSIDESYANIIDIKQYERCYLIKNKNYLSVEQYTKLLYELSVKCARYIKLKYVDSLNPNLFIQECQYEMQKRFETFKSSDAGFLKILAPIFYASGPNEPMTKLEAESSFIVSNQALYLPFIKTQYETLFNFSQSFHKKYKLNKDRSRRRSVVFKYKELYTNVKTRYEFKQILQTFLQKIKVYQKVDKISTDAYLKYFGLKESQSYIKWDGKTSNFFSFNKYLADTQILIGHNRNSLRECVVFNNNTNHKWDNFRSSKHCDDLPEIVALIKSFISDLDKLQIKLSASNSALKK